MEVINLCLREVKSLLASEVEGKVELQIQLALRIFLALVLQILDHLEPFLLYLHLSELL
jgi:hypothetical protein